MSRISELEARLDTLTTAILLPMRATKYVDQDAFAQLDRLVGDLISEIGDAPDISRRLTGKLWFVFTQALTEAQHSRSPDEILRYAWSYQDKLEQLFGPWFSLGPPTPPGVPRY
ncbi:MAG TPA: hypothetical protein VN847_04415 [Streptosporangiaceae bacterium]|nr:hypothetical protein [Streptosporangiaceae bacterium]